MELMRYIAMSTEQARVVAEDFEWKGHHLKKGDLMHVMTAGANRDPLAFDQPERMDLTRNQDNNVTFAPGTHHCIGHLFAKMQLTEFSRNSCVAMTASRSSMKNFSSAAG